MGDAGAFDDLVVEIEVELAILDHQLQQLDDVARVHLTGVRRHRAGQVGQTDDREGVFDISVASSYCTSMSGVQFLVDDRGRKTAAVIDLKKHADVWEDFYDVLLARRRVHEPRESLASVKRRLIRSGKLRG